MLSFAAPAWLPGLLLLPLLRALHRGAPPRERVTVAHAALWPAAPPGSSDARGPLPPDPAWRRRALLLALLLAALAGPRWGSAPPRITLWIDDAPSLALRAPGDTAVWAALQAALAERPAAELELRRLSDPWRPLPPDALAEFAAGRAPAADRVPPAPPQRLLGAAREAWWIGDDVHDPAARWPAEAPPARRFVLPRDGARNAGVLSLAARRDEAAAGLRVAVRVANGGSATEQRELRLRAGARVLAQWSVSLAPGESAEREARVDSGDAEALEAVLSPGDALSGDDAMALSLAALQRQAVVVDPGCGTALRAAVATHPALRLADRGAPAAATLACGPPPAPGSAPATWQFVADRLPEPLQGAVAWSDAVPEDQRFDLPAGARTAARLIADRGDAVLLSSAGRPLVVRRAGPPLHWQVALDAPSLVADGGAALPLLLDGLVAQRFGAAPLDAQARVAREVEALRVVAAPAASAPTRASAATAAPAAPAVAAPPNDAAPWLAGAAALVLLWELAALFAQGRRARPGPVR